MSKRFYHLLRAWTKIKSCVAFKQTAYVFGMNPFLDVDRIIRYASKIVQNEGFCVIRHQLRGLAHQLRYKREGGTI